MRRSLSASGDGVPEGQAAEMKLEEGKCGHMGVHTVPANTSNQCLLDFIVSVLTLKAQPEYAFVESWNVVSLVYFSNKLGSRFLYLSHNKCGQAM